MSKYRHNHYVPVWYQRRFMLPGQHKYFRLDLKPETVRGEGFIYTRRDVHEWSPEKIFAEDDLYTQSGPASPIPTLSSFSLASLITPRHQRSIFLRLTIMSTSIKMR